MSNIAPCFSSHYQKRYFLVFPKDEELCPEWGFQVMATKTTLGFFMPGTSGRVPSTPPPGLDGAGRQGESRYAKSITPWISNNSNQNSSYNKVILVMTLPIGDEVKRLFIQYGHFKLKDSWVSLLEGVGRHHYQAVFLSTG